MQRQTLHVMDGQRRVALVETLTWDGGVELSTTTGTVTVQRFQLGNHLDSVSAEVNEDGDLISYEEYHPYGTAAWRAASSAFAVSAKRYRYTGMERDEETGLALHGVRLYAPWLGRWCSADPIGLGDGVNQYAYVRGNPVSGRDPTGFATTEEWQRVGDTLKSIKAYRDETEGGLPWHKAQLDEIEAETTFRPDTPGAFNVSHSEAMASVDASRMLEGAVRPEVILAIAQNEGAVTPFSRQQLSGSAIVVAADNADEARAFFRSRIFFDSVGLDRATSHPSRTGPGDNPRPTFVRGTGPDHDARFEAVVRSATRDGLLPGSWAATVNQEIEVTPGRFGTGTFTVRAKPMLRAHIMATQAAHFGQRLNEARAVIGDQEEELGIAYFGYNRPDQMQRRFIDVADDPAALQGAIDWAFHSKIEEGRDWSQLKMTGLRVMALADAYQRMFQIAGI